MSGWTPSRILMKVIEIEVETADTILPNKRNIYKDSDRRTGSIIPGITRFTVVRGSHDLSCPKQLTTGTGVGVLTLDLTNLCKIELPPLPPQSGTPPSLRCHVDQLTGEEMSFPVSKGPTADSCFTLGRGNSSNQKSLGDVSYKPFAPENYDFLTGVTAHKPSPCSQLAVIPSWVSTCQPWVKAYT